MDNLNGPWQAIQMVAEGHTPIGVRYGVRGPIISSAMLTYTRWELLWLYVQEAVEKMQLRLGAFGVETSEMEWYTIEFEPFVADPEDDE